MEKVYDPATGHEVRELTGKNAGQKYLVDSSGVYAGLYGSGGFNVTPISYDTTGITTASGLGTDTGITPTSVSGTDTGIQSGAPEGFTANDILAAGVGNQPKFLEYDINNDGKISSQDALAYLNQGIADGTMNADGTFAQAASVSNEVAPAYNGPDYSTAISSGFADMNRGFGDAGTDRATMNTLALNREAVAANSRNQMGTDLTSGFRDMTGRFNTVDTNVGNVQGAVDRGFVDQQAGFADAQTNRDAQAQAAQLDRNMQFKAAGEALDTGFGAATNQRTEAQANVLKGQTGLGTTLQTIGDTADIYAGQSLENQQAMQQGIDTQASTFDDYISRYSDDTQFAQDDRRDLAIAQSNFADQMESDVAMYNNNRGRDFETQQRQLGEIRDQQLLEAAAAAEANYQNSLSQLQLGANAQSGNPVPAGLGSPFAVTQ